MWNLNNDVEKSKEELDDDDEDDSWEVKAFAEDTSNVMGTTWPPRSYTCSFCKREFRSAQALGGHMNVHRRDRARLHQPQLQLPASYNLNKISSSNNSNSTTTTHLFIPTQQLNVANGGGGLCLLYSLPKPNSSLNNNNNIKAAVSPHSFNSPLLSYSSYTEAVSTTTSKKSPCKSKEKVMSIINEKKRKKIDSTVEGIDLELRLGCNSFGF